MHLKDEIRSSLVHKKARMEQIVPAGAGARRNTIYFRPTGGLRKAGINPASTLLGDQWARAVGAGFTPAFRPLLNRRDILPPEQLEQYGLKRMA